MKLEPKDVMKAILDNDTDRAAEMLEGFDLRKDCTIPHFTSADKGLVSTMLGAALVAASHKNLAEDLAHELIERTAMTVDIFQFLRLVVAYAEIENKDFDAIPENIRTALRRDDYTDQIASAIEDLDDCIFKALLAYYLTEEVKTSYVKFNLPVIRHIYNDEVIPANLLFAFMASSLRETIDEHFGGLRLHGAFGALDDSGLFGAFFGGMYGDGDDDGKF